MPFFDIFLSRKTGRPSGDMREPGSSSLTPYGSFPEQQGFMPGNNPGARRIHGPNGPAFGNGNRIIRNRGIGGILQQGPSMGGPDPVVGAGHHSERPASMPFQWNQGGGGGGGGSARADEEIE
jgi:hypothetical protein